VANQVTTNIAEPVADRVAEGLTTVVQTIESYDASAAQRPVVYGAARIEGQPEETKD